MRRLAACVAFVFAAPLFAQSPEVIAMEAKQKAFQDRGLKVLQAEDAREKRGDCLTAQSTPVVNNCMEREMAITDANYKSYVLALGGVLRLSTTPEEATAAAETARKFDAAEALWSNYRKAACDAVYQHYMAGTVRGFAYASCMQTLTRSHLHELARTYEEAMQH
jgi:uncharacterized protein YecT (DUF1311 family)